MSARTCPWTSTVPAGPEASFEADGARGARAARGAAVVPRSAYPRRAGTPRRGRRAADAGQCSVGVVREVGGEPGLRLAAGHAATPGVVLDLVAAQAPHAEVARGRVAQVQAPDAGRP